MQEPLDNRDLKERVRHRPAMYFGNSPGRLNSVLRRLVSGSLQVRQASSIGIVLAPDRVELSDDGLLLPKSVRSYCEIQEATERQLHALRTEVDFLGCASEWLVARLANTTLNYTNGELRLGAARGRLPQGTWLAFAPSPDIFPPDEQRSVSYLTGLLRDLATFANGASIELVDTLHSSVKLQYPEGAASRLTEMLSCQKHSAQAPMVRIVHQCSEGSCELALQVHRHELPPGFRMVQSFVNGERTVAHGSHLRAFRSRIKKWLPEGFTYSVLLNVQLAEPNWYGSTRNELRDRSAAKLVHESLRQNEDLLRSAIG